MVKIAILNLYLHQLEKAQVSMMNPLTTGFGGAYPGKMFDCILANPPFSGRVQDESILSDLNYKLNTRATELLFLKWFIDHLDQDGIAGIVVPEGVVMGTDKASRELRRVLIEENCLDAVVSLPHACFKPYASVATFVLIFRKSERSKKVWMYQLAADGFSSDGAREPIEANDIPDLFSQWHNRLQGSYFPMEGKHGWVGIDTIKESKDLELAPRCYLSRTGIVHHYPVLKVEDLCVLEKGTIPAAKAEPGPYPLVTTAENLKSSASYQYDCEAVCIPLVSATGHGHASIKRITYINGKFSAASIIAVLQVKDTSQLLPRFLHFFLEAHKEQLLVPLMKGAANVSLSLGKIGSVFIPIPPINEQRKLVSDLVQIESSIEKLVAEVDEMCVKRASAFAKFKSKFL